MLARIAWWIAWTGWTDFNWLTSMIYGVFIIRVSLGASPLFPSAFSFHDSCSCSTDFDLDAFEVRVSVALVLWTIVCFCPPMLHSSKNEMSARTQFNWDLSLNGLSSYKVSLTHFLIVSIFFRIPGFILPKCDAGNTAIAGINRELLCDASLYLQNLLLHPHAFDEWFHWAS